MSRVPRYRVPGAAKRLLLALCGEGISFRSTDCWRIDEETGARERKIIRRIRKPGLSRLQEAQEIQSRRSHGRRPD